MSASTQTPTEVTSDTTNIGTTTRRRSRSKSATTATETAAANGAPTTTKPVKTKASSGLPFFVVYHKRDDELPPGAKKVHPPGHWGDGTTGAALFQAETRAAAASLTAAPVDGPFKNRKEALSSINDDDEDAGDEGEKNED